MEEIVADSCEMMLEDTRLPEIMAKEKPGLYEQIRERIANFAEKLRKAFTGVEARHEEARAMMQYAEEMQQIWDNALAGAVRNTEAATENGTAAPNNGTAAPNNGTKNARRENQQLEEHEVVTALYDALDHADAGHDNVIKVGRMPQFVRELTGIDGDFYIYRNHMYSNIKTEKEAKAEGRYKKGEHYHGVGMERMTDAIMAIETPVLTINDTKKNGNPEITMVLPVKGTDGTPLYAALGFYAPQSIKGSMAQRPHIILSIYERLEGMSPEGREYKGLTAVIDEAAKEKKVLSYDKTKRDILPLTAQLSTLGSITDTSLKENIAQFQKEVNNFKQKNKINYSMRDTAYTTAVESGNTEAAQRLVDEAAEEALENSEARLTDRGEFRMGAGKLATVYHATYNDFTVFDRAKLGENTDAYASDESTAATAHLGFWFNTQPLSQSASYAGGKDVKAYLNAENIYNAHSLEQLTGEIEQQWDEELTPEENAEEYVDGLKAQGYDGIVLRDEEFGGTSFVVFDPEQIKSAEAITYDDAGNVIPLSERFNSRSNDIRYSMRDVAADDTADERRGRGAWIKILKHIFKHHASACCFFYVFFYVYLSKSMTDSAARQG